jgi:hypothetical protein
MITTRFFYQFYNLLAFSKQPSSPQVTVYMTDDELIETRVILFGSSPKWSCPLFADASIHGLDL